jgi:hypothetical protein
VPRRWVFALLVLCTLLNGAGFLWDIFELVPLYDEIVHVITPFTLVAVTAEIIYRAGGDDEFFDTPRHALLTGSVIGLIGAVGKRESRYCSIPSSPQPASTTPSPTRSLTWCSASSGARPEPGQQIVTQIPSSTALARALAALGSVSEPP